MSPRNDPGIILQVTKKIEVMKVLILCALFVAAHSAGLRHAILAPGAIVAPPAAVVASPAVVAPAAAVFPAPVAHVDTAVVAPVPVVAVAPVEDGVSTQVRNQDSLGNYNFAYQEDHTSGGSFRKEAGDALGNVAGSYGLHVADGRVRVVNYIANDDGFRADIKTNEPGVAPEDPADTTINKEPGVVLAAAAGPVAAPIPVVPPAPVALAAPVPVAVAAPAPVVVPAPTLALAAPAAALPEEVAKGADAIAAVRAHEGTLPHIVHAVPAVPAVPAVVGADIAAVNAAAVFPETQGAVVKSFGAPVAPPVAVVNAKGSDLFPPASAVVAKSYGVHPLNAFSTAHVFAGHPYGAYGYGYATHV